MNPGGRPARARPPATVRGRQPDCERHLGVLSHSSKMAFPESRSVLRLSPGWASPPSRVGNLALQITLVLLSQAASPTAVPRPLAGAVAGESERATGWAEGELFTGEWSGSREKLADHGITSTSITSQKHL